MFAFVSSFNTGRLDASVYTLEKIEAMRQSLASGIIASGGPVTVTADKFPVDPALDLLVDLINANKAKSEGALPRPIGGTDAKTIIERLEALRGKEFPAIVDGNHRNFASLLQLGVTGKPFDLPKVKVDTPKGWQLESLKANTLLRTAADWKTRTHGVMAGIETGTFKAEKDLMDLMGWKRGVAQHAWASATACRAWSLEVAKCASLTAQEWRTVKDCTTQAEAMALAYGVTETVETFRPKTAAQRKIDVGFPKDDPRHAILLALANGDAAAFDAYFC